MRPVPAEVVAQAASVGLDLRAMRSRMYSAKAALLDHYGYRVNRGLEGARAAAGDHGELHQLRWAAGLS